MCLKFIGFKKREARECESTRARERECDSEVEISLPRPRTLAGYPFWSSWSILGRPSYSVYDRKKPKFRYSPQKYVKIKFSIKKYRFTTLAYNLSGL